MIDRKYLTIAMRIDDPENRGPFVDEIFQRFMEQQARDGVEIFAASWSNVFQELEDLEAKIERMREGEE